MVVSFASSSPASPEKTRRDFLYLATGAVGAVCAGAVLWPLIDQMEPDAATIAAGAGIDVDLSSLEPGQQITVKWRGHPMFIVNRPPDVLKTLQDQRLVERLSDPDSRVVQQPQYADNWHRSLNPAYGVMVGVCTHLGCIPKFMPTPGSVSSDWPGGYFCPCHGSKYDLAGRVFRGVPAPYNLPVPPYTFIAEKKIRIGANPEGQAFQLDDVVQL